MKICSFLSPAFTRSVLLCRLHLQNLQKMECIVLEWRKWHKNVFCFVVCFHPAWRWNLASWMAEYDRGLRVFFLSLDGFLLSFTLFFLKLDGMLFAYMMGHCRMTWEDVLSLSFARYNCCTKPWRQSKVVCFGWFSYGFCPFVTNWL